MKIKSTTNINNESKRQKKVVNRGSHEPAYMQICNMLKDQIASGVYRPGSRLPSESQLRRIHNVSPMTVRRSIKILLDQGVVTTIQGSGTFVKAPDLGEVAFSLRQFYDLFKDENAIRTKLLEVKIRKAEEDVAAYLGIEKGVRTILLRRLLIKDGDPMIYHVEHLIYDPLRPIVETELEVTTLYGLFQRSGQTFLKRGDLSLEATVLDAEAADLLNTMPLQPAFRIAHLFYDFDEKPFSWGQFICRADCLHFKTTVGIEVSDD